MLQVISRLPQRATRPTGHVAMVLLLLVTQLLARQILTSYYKLVLRPHLIARGAKSCGEYSGDFTARCGEQCDIMVVTADADAVQRRFYSVGGGISISLRTISGRVVDDSIHYWSHMADLALPSIATGLLLIAVLRKMARTGSIFTLQMARHKWDRQEKILLLYSIPLMALGIIMPILRR